MAFDDNIPGDSKDTQRPGKGSGIYTPIKTPHDENADPGDRYGVFYEPGTVGAGDFRPSAGATLQDVALKGSANAYLQDGNDYMPLWLNELKFDFSTTGMTAQSRIKRDFYHRYFTQPQAQISGQTFNQYQYNWLAKFIRRNQIRQVAFGANFDNRSILTLVIKAPHDSIDDNPPVTNGNVKGPYMPMTLKGYVQSISAGARRFVNAPPYTFSFVILNAETGIMAMLDRLITRNEAADFLAQYGADPKRRFVVDPKIPPPEAWTTPGSAGDEGGSLPPSDGGGDVPSNDATAFTAPVVTNPLFEQAFPEMSGQGGPLGIVNDF